MLNYVQILMVLEKREFINAEVVPPAGIEPALPEKPDFESGASTSSATVACADAMIIS